MASNHIQPGEVITYTATAATAAGAGVKIGSLIGVSLVNLAAGETGSVAIDGVWRLPKLASDNMTQGAPVYWDDTNKRLTLTASGNTLAGNVIEAAAASTTTVAIKLNV
jgi:predicted RecA/RadA family phage recombinase